MMVVVVGCNAPKPIPTINNEQSGGTLIDPPKTITTVKPFTNQFGKPEYLSDLKGKVALIFFGYTNCPDVCPTTISEFKFIKNQLEAQANQVAFVFISVDPQRDTPEVLERFISGFDPSFIAWTTDEGTLQALAKEFYTSFGVVDAMGMVEHGSRTYLLDKAGQWRIAYPIGTSVKVVADDIRTWLNKS